MSSDLFAKLTTPNGLTYDQPLGLFINNEWVKTGSTIDSINPSTGEVITSVYAASEKDIDSAVDAARAAFESDDWSGISGSERGEYLYKIYEIIKRDTELLAAVESMDNGKPYEAECIPSDVTQGANVFKYYAGWADKITGEFIGTEVLGKNKISYVDPSPIGVVGQIVPWNFPFLMLTWKVAPALATGNTVVLKSSEITPLSALYFAKIVKEAGLPKGVVNIISGYGRDAGARLSSHPKVDKVAFTGSSFTAGKILEASAASNLKNVTLEAGGKSPFICFEDCDFEEAVKWAYIGIFTNKGEVCVSTSRMFIHESIYDKFVEAFVKHVEEKAKVSCPFKKGCTLGPVVSELQYNKVKKYIDIGKKEGAKLMTGEFLEGPGYFAKPFVFADTTDDMTIMKDEIFGPVACITKFKTVDEVVKRANSTPYGLAASIFTNNITKANAVARRIDSGMIFINSNCDFDLHIPFGGVKQSGIGRELGKYAIDVYTEPKAIHINLGLKY